MNKDLNQLELITSSRKFGASSLISFLMHLLASIIQQAKRANIPIAVCGEMAGDPSLTKLLLAMGLTDFSMHFSQLLLVKREILNANVGMLKARFPRVLKAYEPEAQAKALERLLA